MATGTLIIYAGKGAAAEHLREIGCAVTFTPEDPAAMSIAVTELLWDPERRRVLVGRVGPVYSRILPGQVDGEAGYTTEEALLLMDPTRSNDRGVVSGDPT